MANRAIINPLDVEKKRELSRPRIRNGCNVLGGEGQLSLMKAQ